MELHGKIGLVTGGTRGIGAACAAELASRGALVSLVGRHLDDEAMRTRERIEAQVELADDNIGVNCMAPGVIRPAFHAGVTDEQKRLNLDHRIPLHRERAPPSRWRAWAWSSSPTTT
jgi:NAD(P)-dependent dehydrogenase (short-subunit alcohol dehydrogenase family)